MRKANTQRYFFKKLFLGDWTVGGFKFISVFLIFIVSMYFILQMLGENVTLFCIIF